MLKSNIKYYKSINETKKKQQKSHLELKINNQFKIKRNKNCNAKIEITPPPRFKTLEHHICFTENCICFEGFGFYL